MGFLSKLWFVEMKVKKDGVWTKGTANLEKGILTPWSDAVDALIEEEGYDDVQITSIKELK